MKKWVIIGIIIAVIVLVIIVVFIIYPEKECKTDADCLTKTCLTVQCIDKKCAYSSTTDCCGNEICEVGETYESCVADCPDCDDINDCTLDSYDYHEQKCVNEPILDVICCGNGLCEVGETYENCARDCPNCDDANECTEDSYDYHEQKCVNEPIIPCCGNEICDENAETYSSCSIDCSDCNDDDGITTDSFNYATQKCENIIISYFTDDFEEGAGNPSGWSPDLPDYMAWDTEQVQSGLKSLKTTVSNVPLPGGWFFWKSDFISVKANQKYYLREWIKTENADQGAQVDVHFFDDSYIDIGNGGSAGLLSGTNDWTFRESTFITPPGTEYIQILNGFYGTNGIAWFDNLTLIEDTG